MDDSLRSLRGTPSAEPLSEPLSTDGLGSPPRSAQVHGEGLGLAPHGGVVGGGIASMTSMARMRAEQMDLQTSAVWAGAQRGFLPSAAKRGFDLLLSSFGLLLSLPLWVVIPLAIKLEDGGPVLFVQERWGRFGRGIRVFKFRTMIKDAERIYGSLQATADDPRITRVGKILRATALDELPQLLNIWLGEMSFVGPRALPMNEIQRREPGAGIEDSAISGFDVRLAVRPGLTGVAQVYAPRDVPRRHKFRYDSLYIRRQCLWLDLRLVLLSVWITLRGGWEKRGRRPGGVASDEQR